MGSRILISRSLLSTPIQPILARISVPLRPRRKKAILKSFSTGRTDLYSESGRIPVSRELGARQIDHIKLRRPANARLHPRSRLSLSLRTGKGGKLARFPNSDRRYPRRESRPPNSETLESQSSGLGLSRWTFDNAAYKYDTLCR